MITRQPSSTWYGLTDEHWARVGVIVQLAIMIRTLGEFYRLRHYYGTAVALLRYEPYIGGLLINAVLCLITVALLFWRKPRPAGLTAAATILVLLIYKIIAIS